MTLVIHELAINAERHGGAGGTARSAKWTVSAADQTVSIESRDDGPGFPDDVLRRERRGLGLQLAEMIVRHELHGTLDLANDGGAVATVRFGLRPPSTLAAAS